MGQENAGSCDAEGGLGSDASIKTEENDGFNSPSDHCSNQNESSSQWHESRIVVSKSVDPLTEIGTKRRRVERQSGFSKVKSISLAPPTMCAQIMVKK